MQQTRQRPTVMGTVSAEPRRDSDESAAGRQLTPRQLRGEISTLGASFRVRLDPFVANHDLPRLRAWLGSPHVARWWLDADEAIAVASRHCPTDHAIIIANDTPVGYICWQKLSREELEAAGLTDLPPDHVDIDILIGDPEFVGKGIGPRALALLLERLRSEGVKSVGLASAVDNQRARWAYRKAGFRSFRRFREDKQHMYYFVKNL